MASKRAYLDHLRSVPLFSGCSMKELQIVAKAGTELTVPAGTTIIDQGQAGREAFVVMSGSLTVKRNGKKVASLGVGSMVGDLALLDHGPRTASVITDTECNLFVIDQRSFAGVLDTVPTLSHKLLASLAGRIREFDRAYYG
jgi:CRP/FNR family transcriptional regulator, cyclic AMP receptor protein